MSLSDEMAFVLYIIGVAAAWVSGYLVGRIRTRRDNEERYDRRSSGRYRSS